jgi:hypothetical protein
MKILRTTDRVKIKLGEVVLTVKPMTQAQKIEMSRLVTTQDGKQISYATEMLTFVVKHTVKEMEGVTDLNGDAIKLGFLEDGSMDEESVSDVMAVLVEKAILYMPIMAVAKNKLPEPNTPDLPEGVEATYAGKSTA